MKGNGKVYMARIGGRKRIGGEHPILSKLSQTPLGLLLKTREGRKDELEYALGLCILYPIHSMT